MKYVYSIVIIFTYSMLFGFSTIITAPLSKQDTKILNQVVLMAEIMLISRYDDDYPKRKITYRTHLDMSCSLRNQDIHDYVAFSLSKYNPKIEIEQFGDQQYSISISLERLDFDYIYQLVHGDVHHESQAVFDFYQLDK